MEEIELVKCDNIIFADEVVSILRKNGVASRQHDENQDPVVGAYGPKTGIAIYVFKKDYERALSFVRLIDEERNKVRPFCPKCKNEDVTPILHRHNYCTAIMLLTIFLILIPVIYFMLFSKFGLRSNLADTIALVIAILGFVLIPFAARRNTNYKCRSCGHKFYHLCIIICVMMSATSVNLSNLLKSSINCSTFL